MDEDIITPKLEAKNGQTFDNWLWWGGKVFVDGGVLHLSCLFDANYVRWLGYYDFLLQQHSTFWYCLIILHCWGELVVSMLDLEDAIYGMLQETLYEEVLEAIDGSKIK